MEKTRPAIRRDDPRGNAAAARIGTALGIFSGAVLTYLLFRVAAGRPALVEALFSSGWAAAVVPSLSRLTGLVPIPLVEVLGIGYLLWRLWTASRAGAHVLVGRRSSGEVAGAGAAVLVRDVGLAVILFYALWGFHYSRAPVADRLGLPPLESASTGELVELGRGLTAAANQSYRVLHGTDDAGAPTTAPDRWTELDEALRRGWSRAAADLGMGPLASARFGPPKRLLLGSLAARLGLTGFYSPFTAEALVVGSTPAVSLGMGLAHEQAHQRGITAEGDATFAGFLAAVRSGHPLLRYSAAVRAQSRVLALLGQWDPRAARRVMAERIPGVRRDLRDLRAYRMRNRGAASRATRRVNDGYLRANRVAGGIDSYDEVTQLLVRYARLGGEGLRPEPLAPDRRRTVTPAESP